MSLSKTKLLCVLALVLSVAGCSSKKDGKASSNTKNTLQHIKVQLSAKSDSSVAGTVEFIEETNGVRVIANVSGLQANSKHGFHIHEKPDCTAPDASSAGGHFNPMGHDHGSPNTEFHAGDLGNLETDAEGIAKLDMIFSHISLTPADAAYIVNRSVVIHADEDDFESQPAGNAGARVACGTITL